jgi:hypothetical protein
MNRAIFLMVLILLPNLANANLRTDSIKGTVYEIGEETKKIPDLSVLDPKFTLTREDFNLPLAKYFEGFPGFGEFREWFAARFETTLHVLESGTYDLVLISDDGAILYIDGVAVIDNDGDHKFTAKSGKVSLTAGPHPLKLDYYQGGGDLGLQILWAKPDGLQFKFLGQR